MPQVSKTIKIGLSATDKQNMSQEVYERLLDLTFQEYSTSETYREGIFVVYNNELYKCIGSTGGAWDSSKWQLATLNDLLEDIEAAVAFVNGKANVDGNYPTLTSGLALNLDSKLTLKDQNAFSFRTTAGAEEIGDPAKVNNIIGGTIFWNQLVQNGNFSNGLTSWSYNAIGDASTTGNVLTYTATAQYAGVYKDISVIKNHKYLVVGFIKSSSTNVRLQVDERGESTTYRRINSSANNKLEGIFTLITIAQDNASVRIGVSDTRSSDWDEVQATNFQLIDLTTMLGATIADYIYSLETATAGAGIAWFKKYFPKEYYAYSVPTPMHIKISGIRMNRFNQWDEEWEVGTINNGNNSSDRNDVIRSKNHIHVIPKTTYYLKFPGSTYIYVSWYDVNKQFISETTENTNTTFVVPANAHYLRFRTLSTYGTTYNHDICINLHWDGERDGEYEEAFTELYPVDDIELKGIPMIDSEGNLYFDGDKYWYDGTVDEEYELIDLGNYNWSQNGSNHNLWYTNGASSVIKPKGKSLCASMLEAILYDDRDYETTTPIIWLHSGGEIYIVNPAFAELTQAQVKTALTGIKYLIEKKNITQSSVTPFSQVQSRDNWGTEEIVDAHTGDVVMPTSVSHEYLPDLKAKVESAPANPENDGDYVMHREDGENEYIPLGTWLSDNGYEKDVSAKENLGGILRHQLVAQVVADGGTLDFDDTDVVDLGDLSWDYYTSADYPYMRGFGIQNSIYKPLGNNDIGVAISCYKLLSGRNISVDGYYGFAIDDYGNVRIRTTDMGTDPTTFKNTMKGILLAYKKASS